jgi:Tfp pilus assembly protein PilF
MAPYSEPEMSLWNRLRAGTQFGLICLGLAGFSVMQAQSTTSATGRQYKALDPMIGKAYKALKAQRFDEARGILKPCLEQIPDHFEAHYFLALDFEGRNYASALQHLDTSERTLRLLEKDYSAQVAEMKARAEAAEREAQDNLNNALSHTSDPTGGAAKQIAGLKMDLKVSTANGSPVQGLQNPYEVPADYLFLRGNVLLRLGQRDEARQSYRRAVIADKTHANAWNNLVALGFGAKDFAGAAADLAKAEAAGVVIRPELKKAVLAAQREGSPAPS